MTIDLRTLLAVGCLTTILLVTGCAQDNASASDPNVPGATGRTVVPGSTSTRAGDAEATSQQQKWPLSRDR